MTENEHILTCLAEECAEVAKNVSKALRFGLDDRFPQDGPANNELIQSEVIDFVAVYDLASKRGLVLPLGIMVPPEFRDAMFEKQARVLKWMDYARTQGAITE